MDAALVIAALCAHDVVYTGAHGVDEQASAEWLRTALTQCGVPAELIELAAKLVAATASHDGSADALTQVVCDADLSILAAEPSRYDRYVQQVRDEYANFGVGEPMWRTGRGAVLRAMLAKPRLFHCGPRAAARDAKARDNLSRELRRLLDPAGEGF